MAIHWQISFRSLRANTLYTVNIYDSTYSGTPIPLKGGAQSFITEEDDDDDPFIPIRTQTGSICIVDDGYAADGVTAVDWKEIMPQTGHSRPVTLTHEENGATITDWQGFMQAQDFSGVLYGNPQEREFSVQCPLMALNSQQPSVSDVECKNFAYVLNLAAATIEALSLQTIGFDDIYIQGNTDARAWLLKKFDWMNVLKDDDEEELKPQYDIYEITEDVCRFWGWSMRTKGRTMYLTCYDDSSEQKFLHLTRNELRQLGAGTSTGTADITLTPYTLEGDIFASTDNEDYKRQGPDKATVGADCNEQDVVLEFAPVSVEKTMDNTGYTWVNGNHTNTGYFTTQTIRTFDSLRLSGSATQDGGFCRRQIFTDRDQESADKADLVIAHAFSKTTPCAQLTMKRWRNYGGGSLSISGSVYQEAKVMEATDDSWYMFVRIGIGTSRSAAKWFRLTCDENGNIFRSWTTSPQMLAVHVNSNSLNGFAAYKFISEEAYISDTDIDWGNFAAIPVDAGLNGQLFLDIMGFHSYNGGVTTGEIADLRVKFSRDTTYIVNNTTQTRPRTMSNERVSSMDYKAINTNGSGNEWNTDCIFASDNNMEYGYGLIMNTDGTWMDKAIYNSVNEYPEQHLANRVSAFWASNKRQVIAVLRSDAVADISPLYKLTMESVWRFHPIAISRDWWNDETTIKMLQSNI